MLASLWATDSNYSRLTGLAADTAHPLSHFHPDPEDIEPARSAAVVCTLSLFMGHGPHAVRQLVTLRRLPPAEPDTLMRALGVVLCALPEVHPPHYTAAARAVRIAQAAARGRRRVLRQLCVGVRA